jgi:hypothetical protein
MEEKFSLAPVDALWPGPSSEWLEIWKKPYNSGIAVYLSEAGAYYFGTYYRIYIFDPSQGTLKASCHPKDVPARTPLATQLEGFSREDDTIDPGAKQPFSFVEAEHESVSIPTSPPSSRYYANLKYLGRFGLVRSGGRGGKVIFVSAGRAPEPRLGLRINCG